MSEPLWTDVVGTWSALASAVFGLVALAAVFYVGNQIRLQRTQLHRDLENLYIQRYWSLMDRLAEAALWSPEEASHRRKLAIGAYLRLSEDECDLRAADRVTDATWREWLDGIRTQLADPEFRNELDAAPEGQLQNLKQLVENPEDFEPSITAPRIRQRRGL